LRITNALADGVAIAGIDHRQAGMRDNDEALKLPSGVERGLAH
jgi:hypothetical protein